MSANNRQRARTHAAQPAVRQWPTARYGENRPKYYQPAGDPVQFFGTDREEFLRHSENRALPTDAFVTTAGQWIQPSDDLRDLNHRAFLERFRAYIDGRSSDAFAVRLGCHY